MDLFGYVSAIWAAGGVIPVAGALIYKGQKTPAGGLLSMLGGSLAYIYTLIWPLTFVDDPAAALFPRVSDSLYCRQPHWKAC